MKTFRQIADDNNLDRTTIFKRTKKIPNFKTEHMTKKNGKWFVDDDGVKLLAEHKNVRPKKYKSRINTKYDYFKRAKSLADENKWLRSKMDDLMATNARQATRLADDKQMEQEIRALANSSKQNEKQLTAKKSANQPKLGEQYHASDDKTEFDNLELRNKVKKLHHKLKTRPVKYESFWHALSNLWKH